MADFSKLGFGTSGIMGAALTDRGRLQLLDCAFDHDITHFDTAPLYGMGDAEQLVGKFAHDKRHKITIATKYGLKPRRLNRYQRSVLPFARVLNRGSKSARERLKALLKPIRQHIGAQPVHTSSPASAHSQPSPYPIQDIEAQLNNSLKQLNTDYVDFYLLHECNALQLNDQVVDYLNNLVKRGKIRYYGLATGTSESIAILNRYPGFSGAVQVPVTMVQGETELSMLNNNRLTIIHSVYASAVSLTQQYLNKHPETRKEWEQALEMNLSEQETVSRLILEQIRRQNPHDIMLFSSSTRRRIKSNTEQLSERYFTPQQLCRFFALMQRDVLQ